MNRQIYAEPRYIQNIDDCWFYHTMELPEIGTIEGNWDIRGHEAEYLGNSQLRGKRVLEVGPASGHLTFYMEKQGAEVVCCDLSHDMEWDMVPMATLDQGTLHKERQAVLKQLNNSFWFAHRMLHSNARVIYSPVYDFPAEAGSFDVAVFTAVLLHLRDPFRALQHILHFVNKTAVITDMLEPEDDDSSRPTMTFLPDPAKGGPIDTWWRLSPSAIRAMLAVLGFSTIAQTRHQQIRKGASLRFFTIVAERDRQQATVAVQNQNLQK